MEVFEMKVASVYKRPYCLPYIDATIIAKNMLPESLHGIIDMRNSLFTL